MFVAGDDIERRYSLIKTPIRVIVHAEEEQHVVAKPQRELRSGQGAGAYANAWLDQPLQTHSGAWSSGFFPFVAKVQSQQKPL